MFAAIGMLSQLSIDYITQSPLDYFPTCHLVWSTVNVSSRAASLGQHPFAQQTRQTQQKVSKKWCAII